jgi:hypothetical protein
MLPIITGDITWRWRLFHMAHVFFSVILLTQSSKEVALLR